MTKLEMFGGPKDGERTTLPFGRKAKYYRSVNSPQHAHIYVWGNRGLEYRGLIECASVTQDILPLNMGEERH